MAHRNPNLDRTGKSSPKQEFRLPKDIPAGISWHRDNTGTSKGIRVRFGKKFTGGAAFKRFFATRAEALQGIEQVIRDKPAAALELAKPEIADAKSALAILKGKTSLVAAANYWMQREGRRGDRKLLSDVITEHVNAIRRRSASHTYPEAQRRACEEILKDNPGIYISDITHETLEHVIEARGWQPLNIKNHLRDWRMLFRFAGDPKRRYVIENPVELIEPPQTKHEVQIYTAAAAQRLCETAIVLDNDTLAFAAVGLFSGVRVEEMSRLSWQLFDFEEEGIRLGPEQVKSSGRNRESIPRMVPISAQLRSFLDLVARKEGPFLADNFRRRWDRTKAVAGMPWPGEEKSPFASLRNGLRHSFASHHAVHVGSSTETRQIMGQKSENVFWKHYFHFVSKKEAAKYLAISPPSEARLAEIRPLVEALGKRVSVTGRHVAP